MGTNSSHSSPWGEKLRRSCHFCRRRKIKCSSGQNRGICAACKERGIDCVYDAETNHSREKKQTRHRHVDNVARRSSSASNHPTISGRGSVSAAGISSPPPQLSDVDASGSSIPAYCRDNMEARLPATIGEELELILRTYQGLDSGNEQLAANKMSYGDTFTMMAQSLVMSLARQLGTLGVPGSKYARESNHVPDTTGIKSQIIHDLSDGFERNPLDQIDDAIRLQLVDVWFSNHPLSMILSKTLVLRSCKEHTYDDALLAVILADAHHFQIAGQPSVLERKLFAYAKECLRRQSSSSCNLSTTQALVLLGWHDLCARNLKRSTCFLACSMRILMELKYRTTHRTTILGRQLNGIDIEAVEAELICNLHWIAYIALLHNVMSATGATADYVSWRCPSEPPGMDERHSALISLDKASDQVSTFQQQAQNLRSLWPLAHIASTCYRVLRLCTYRNLQSVATNNTGSLQSGIQIRTGTPSPVDMEHVFRITRKSLAEIVVTVRNDSVSEPSKTLVTLAYYTLIIHLHFPKQHALSPCSVDEDRIKEFCDSSNNLLNVMQCVAGTAPIGVSSTSKMSLPSTIVPDMMSLGLDACGRGFNHLHDRWCAGSEAEHQAVVSHANKLDNLAVDMHHLAKHDFIRTSTCARDAKRLLKAAKRSFSLLSPTQSVVPRSNASSTPELSPDMRVYDSPSTIVRVDSIMSTSTEKQSPSTIDMERVASLQALNLGIYHETMQNTAEVTGMVGKTFQAPLAPSVGDIDIDVNIAGAFPSDTAFAPPWCCEEPSVFYHNYLKPAPDDGNSCLSDFIWPMNTVHSLQSQSKLHYAPSVLNQCPQSHDSGAASSLCYENKTIHGVDIPETEHFISSSAEEAPWIQPPFTCFETASAMSELPVQYGYDVNTSIIRPAEHEIHFNSVVWQAGPVTR